MKYMYHATGQFAVIDPKLKNYETWVRIYCEEGVSLIHRVKLTEYDEIHFYCCKASSAIRYGFGYEAFDAWKGDLSLSLYEELSAFVDVSKLSIEEVVDEITYVSIAESVISNWYDNGYQFDEGGYDIESGVILYSIYDSPQNFKLLEINYTAKTAKLAPKIDPDSEAVVTEFDVDYMKEQVSDIKYRDALAMLSIDSFADMFIVE